MEALILYGKWMEMGGKVEVGVRYENYIQGMIT